MSKTFGELIQEALTEKGWSNAELARRTGFSATHIGNLMRDYSPGTKSGKPTRLPTDTVDRIADALEKPRDLFRRAAGLLPEDIEPVNTREAEAARAAELIESFLQFTPKEQARVLVIIKSMQADHPELIEMMRPPIQIVKPEDLEESDVDEDGDRTRG